MLKNELSCSLPGNPAAVCNHPRPSAAPTRGGPGAIKTERTPTPPPVLPARLSARHLGACWVTLTTGPSEGSRARLRGKDRGSMGNEALLCKWDSFWITLSARTDWRGRTPLQSGCLRKIFIEVSRSCSAVFRHRHFQFKRKPVTNVFFYYYCLATPAPFGSHCVIFQVSRIHFSTFPCCRSSLLRLRVKRWLVDQSGSSGHRRQAEPRCTVWL